MLLMYQELSLSMIYYSSFINHYLSFMYQELSLCIIYVTFHKINKY